MLRINILILGFIMFGLILKFNIVMLERYKNISNVALSQKLSQCYN